MASPGVTIGGTKELTKTLKELSPAEGRRIARRTVTRIAREVRDDMRNNAPLGPTGNLRRSIKSRRKKDDRGEANAIVFVDQSGGKSGKGYHWHLLEYGTVKMSAQPFVNPTIEQWQPKVPAMYRNQWFCEYAKEMEKRAKKQAAKLK